MKSAFKSLQIFLLLCGVFGADELKSVMEGDSVTLNPDLTQIKKFSLLEWKFRDSVIARIDGKDISYPSPTEIFRDRLQLDETGSLTIKNMKTKHSGLYELQISHSDGTTESKFNVTVHESPSKAGQAEVKSLSVTEGAPVSIQTDVKLDGDELIVWRFGDEGKLIAKADMEAKSSPLYDTDERFRGRLELDQTGSLTITNTRTTDSGLYTVKISSKKQTSYKRFTVAVIEPDQSPGLSPGAVAGIVIIAVLAAAAAVAAAVIYYRRKISELQQQTSSVTKTVGEDIPLKPNNKINKDDVIQWMFEEGDQQTVIAEFNEETGEIFKHDDAAADGRFKRRLDLDMLTGSLTIRNSRTAHSGLYTLQITSRSGDSQQRFIVTVNKKVTVESVKYGDSVTLKPDTEIQRVDQILWMFGEQDDLIAQVKAGTGETYDDAAGEIFRGRLKLDEKTGSLTIRNISPEHTGLYKLLTISSSRETLIKKFRVSMPLRTVRMTVGKPVPLSTDHPKIERDDEIEWRFGAEKTLIAEVRGGSVKTYDVRDGRFRDRLKLNDQTGDLTILNSADEHAGYYNLKIRSSNGDTYMTYSVVTARGSSLNIKNASSGKRVNESAVNDPLLEAVVSDGVNEQEGMSSL